MQENILLIYNAQNPLPYPKIRVAEHVIGINIFDNSV